MTDAPLSFLVECTIRRKNGTHPTMWPTDMYPEGKTYHFEPRDGDERHLALVDDPAHLARFASIESSFRIVSAPAPVMATEPAEGTEGAASGGGGPLPNPTLGTEGFPEDDAELRAMFERVIGRKPSHRALRETMIDQIRQKMAEAQTSDTQG